MNSDKLLKLGVHHLSEAEARLVQAMVRLFAIGAPGNFHWVFANQQPFDAVIVDAQSPDMGTPALQCISKVILALSDGLPSVHAYDTLTRPIRSDRLENWLSNMQHKLHASPAKTHHALDTQHCFKLRHWPPAQLLHQDPSRLSMATLMSRQAVTVEELVKITKEPPERCHTFVQLLRSMNLVDVTNAQAVPGPEHPASVAHALPHHHPEPADELPLHMHFGLMSRQSHTIGRPASEGHRFETHNPTLVSNIRKRLGI